MKPVDEFAPPQLVLGWIPVDGLLFPNPVKEGSPTIHQESSNRLLGLLGRL